MRQVVTTLLQTLLLVSLCSIALAKRYDSKDISFELKSNWGWAKIIVLYKGAPIAAIGDSTDYELQYKDTDSTVRPYNKRQGQRLVNDLNRRLLVLENAEQEIEISLDKWNPLQPERLISNDSADVKLILDNLDPQKMEITIERHFIGDDPIIITYSGREIARIGYSQNEFPIRRIENPRADIQLMSFTLDEMAPIVWALNQRIQNAIESKTLLSLDFRSIYSATGTSKELKSPDALLSLLQTNPVALNCRLIYK